MIIGLTGYAQSGKDTVAQVLVNKYAFKRIAFADAIRFFCYEVNPIVGWVANEPVFLQKIVDRDGWEQAKKIGEIRRTLQSTGVAARNKFGSNFWVERAFERVDPINDNIVVTDVRFINEADYIKALPDSQIWRVRRLNLGPVNSHVSESQMDGYKVDQIVLNNGTVSDLEYLLSTRMRGYDL